MAIDELEGTADSLIQMIGPCLLAGASYRRALRKALDAFDENDVEKARLVVTNAARSDGPYDSLSKLIYAALPRSGPSTSAG